MKEEKHPPLSWLIVLLFIVLNAADILTMDIDAQLKGIFKKGGLEPKKKQYLKYYFETMKKARHWLDEMFKLDEIVWDSSDGDSKRYGNAIADSNEIIQFLMYYPDRGHTEGGYEKIMHFLRAMPDNGLFPQSYIERFKINREWVYDTGDRVMTNNHGPGTLDVKVNGNWIVVNLDSGGQTVLNENHFKII